mgnify:CR=1 FL=1
MSVKPLSPTRLPIKLTGPYLQHPHTFSMLAAISAVATYWEASRLTSVILDSDVSLPNHIKHEVPFEIPAPLERLEKFVSGLAEWEIVLLSRLRWEYDPSPFFGVSRLLLRFFAKHELIQLKICKTIWENHTCRPMKASELADFRCNLLSLRACLDHAGLGSYAHRI